MGLFEGIDHTGLLEGMDLMGLLEGIDHTVSTLCLLVRTHKLTNNDNLRNGVCTNQPT
jgi:hypothetical protein